jgi:hypothetical protein
MEVSGLLYDPAALFLGKNLVPIQKQGSVFSRRKKFLHLLEFEPQFVQSIVYSLYHINIQLKLKLYVNRQHSGRIKCIRVHRPSKQIVYMIRM